MEVALWVLIGLAAMATIWLFYPRGNDPHNVN